MADEIKVSVTVYPTEAMKSKLEELARKDSRSLASYIKLVLENHLLQVEAAEVKAAKKLPVAA